MTRAGGLAAALVVAAAAAGSTPQGAVTVWPALKPLLPFSARLSADEQTPVALARLLESLDAVAAAKVAITQADGRPRVAVTVRWRAAAKPSAKLLALMQQLILHAVPGARPADVLVADTCGRVWIRGGVVQVPGGGRKRGGALAAAVVAVAAVVGAAVMWKRRAQALADELPGCLRGMSVREIAGLLQAASPAVRGAVLAAMGDRARRAVRTRLRGPVEMPDTPPPGEVIEAAVGAMLRTRHDLPARRRGDSL